MQESNIAKLKPRIAVCAAFYAGFEVVQFAASHPFQLEFVATSSNDDSEYESKTAALCLEKGILCLRRVNVNNISFVQEVRSRDLDLVILAWWPSIVKREALEAARRGWLNLHPSLLPYNRGKHPYYWSIVEGTPFGVSIHLIDEGIDTGKCVFQKRIPVGITQTGESLYQKSVEENIALFKECYERIVTLDFTAVEQENQVATFHWAHQIQAHSTIELDRQYCAGDLLNIIRARTFRNGPSACFYLDGKKYFVRLQIEEAPAEQEKHSVAEVREASIECQPC